MRFVQDHPGDVFSFGTEGGIFIMDTPHIVYRMDIEDARGMVAAMQEALNAADRKKSAAGRFTHPQMK